MKDNAGVGEELRQIYLPGRRSHHPNDAPCQKTPSPKYHAKNGVPLPPAAGAASGRRGAQHNRRRLEQEKLFRRRRLGDAEDLARKSWKSELDQEKEYNSHLGSQEPREAK